MEKFLTDLVTYAVRATNTTIPCPETYADFKAFILAAADHVANQFRFLLDTPAEGPDSFLDTIPMTDATIQWAYSTVG